MTDDVFDEAADAMNQLVDEVETAGYPELVQGDVTVGELKDNLQDIDDADDRQHLMEKYTAMSDSLSVAYAEVLSDKIIEQPPGNSNAE